MHHPSTRLIPLCVAALVLAGCSVPESGPGAEDPVTLTTTVTSGAEASESPSPVSPTSHTSVASELTQVSDEEFKQPTDEFGNEIWRFNMRGGELKCRAMMGNNWYIGCDIVGWKDAPRTLRPDLVFFGAEANRIAADERGYFRPAFSDPMLDHTTGGKELKPGQSTTIAGYTFAVDDDDVATAKGSMGWFRFDGSLSTQDWVQGVQSNGWADPGNVCKRDKGPAGDNRVFFAGHKGANCDKAMAAFVEYGKALQDGQDHGSAGAAQGDGWMCIGDSSYAFDAAGKDRKEHCEIDGGGEIWVTNPDKYPTPGKLSARL